MENGTPNQFEFSINVLSKELKRVEDLIKYVPNGVIYDGLKKKKVVLNLAILKLKGQMVDWDDFSFPILVLRHNINWLSKQVSIVPSSQKIIKEIEKASNLLTTKT
jgi:hypothetical protein